MTSDPQDERGRANPLLRLLDWLGDLLQDPTDEAEGDPLLGGIEDLPPEEQAARRRLWWGRFRRGRDGW